MHTQAHPHHVHTHNTEIIPHPISYTHSHTHSPTLTPTHCLGSHISTSLPQNGHKHNKQLCAADGYIERAKSRVSTLHHNFQRVALKSIVDQTMMDSSHISLRLENPCWRWSPRYSIMLVGCCGKRWTCRPTTHAICHTCSRHTGEQLTLIMLQLAQ